MEYTVTGTVRLGRGEQPFNRSVDAESEDHARELVLSGLTSEHSISRARVAIDAVEGA